MIDLSQFLSNKTPDEIERAIVKALTQAGRTTHGREWYTPTAISVHTLSWCAKAMNGLGQSQMAGLCALLYGMLDIFGFSGSIRLALNARNEMQRKMVKNGQQRTESSSSNSSTCGDPKPQV